MRFFKYLILLVLFSFSISAFAAFKHQSTGNQIFTSQSSACSAVASKLNYHSGSPYPGSSRNCCMNVLSNGQPVCAAEIPLTVVPDPPPECFYPDYKIVSQSITSLKKTMCLPVNGVICKYVGDPTGSPIVNGKITTTFSSVSKTPDPSCKEDLVNPPCDPKNPYGGCFTPADDGCTRQFNGSIECPAQTSPPIEKGCNGATYCDRPPQGCGTGYVSGSFNGKSLCVKTSPSTGSGSVNEGDGDGTGSGTGSGSNTTDGTGTSTSTGTNTSTTTNSDGSSTTTNTTTNNTTVNNFKIDFSPVVNAVKQVSADIKNLKNELLTSISELTKKLDLTNTKIDTTNTKIDQTNSKLDTSNTSLTSIKDSSLRQEELLKSIRDKSGSGSASGAQTDTDLSGVTSRLDAIKQGIDEQNSSDKEFLDMIKDKNYGTENGDFTGDSKIEILEQTAAPEMKGNILNASAACPAPYVINYDLLGSRSMSFSWDIFCSAASFFRPVFIFLGMFIGFKIATGSYKDS